MGKRYKEIKSHKRLESFSEHVANAITHGVGLAMGVVCLILLGVFASLHHGVWEVVSCSIYGATLVILYLASTLYHSTKSPRARRIFHIIDHSAIYLLIAGTYTPYLLVPLRGVLGWSLLGVVWGCAILGIVLKSLLIGRFKIFSTVSYVVMGWMVVAILVPLIHALPLAAIIWLAAGGLFYTMGVVFYVWKNLKFAHAIWHLFVLAGSLCHFASIFFFVAV